MAVVSCNQFTDRKWLVNIGVRSRYGITRRHTMRSALGGYRDYLVPGVIENQPYIKDAIAQLEVTASVRNARAFESILESLNWDNRSASDFIRVIDLTLRMGAYASARRISEMARERFPQDERIQKHSTILAAPIVTRREVQFDPSIRANRDWLKAHGDEYRGKWIGLRSGELIASADSLEALRSLIGDTRGMLITRVY